MLGIPGLRGSCQQVSSRSSRHGRDTRPCPARASQYKFLGLLLARARHCRAAASLQGAAALWSGWHVAFYVASFGPAFQRVLSLGINLLDHPYRDKSPDATAALANAQFRFRVSVACRLVVSGPGVVGGGRQCSAAPSALRAAQMLGFRQRWEGRKRAGGARQAGRQALTGSAGR